MRSQEPPTLNSYSWQFCAAQRLIIYKTWHFPSELRATLWKSFHFLLHAALQRKGHSRLRLLWPVTALKGRSAAGPAASGCKQALLGEAGAPDWIDEPVTHLRYILSYWNLYAGTYRAWCTKLTHPFLLPPLKVFTSATAASRSLVSALPRCLQVILPAAVTPPLLVRRTVRRSPRWPL